MTRQRSECHVCGKRVRVRANGTYWNHNDDSDPSRGVIPWGVRCAGSGQLVKEGAP